MPPCITGPSNSFSKAIEMADVPVRPYPAPMTSSWRDRSRGMEGLAPIGKTFSFFVLYVAFSPSRPRTSYPESGIKYYVLKENLDVVCLELLMVGFELIYFPSFLDRL